MLASYVQRLHNQSNSVRLRQRLGLPRLLNRPRTHFHHVHNLGSLFDEPGSLSQRPTLSPFQQSHGNQLLVKILLLFLLLLWLCLCVVVGVVKVVEESIDVVGEGRIVDIGKEGVVLGIFEALLEPIVLEPR